MKRPHITTRLALLSCLIVLSLLGFADGYEFILSDGMTHNILRGVLVVSMIIMFVNRRFQMSAARTVSLVIASVVLLFAFMQASEGRLGMIDAAAYFLSSLVLLTEASESAEHDEGIVSPAASGN